MKRRDFLKLIGLGGAVLSISGSTFLLNACYDGAGGGGNGSNFDPRNSEGFSNPLLVPGDDGIFGFFEPQSPFEIISKEMPIPILPGKSTNSMVYEVNQGGKTYINPIIKMRKGNQFNPTLRNELSEETIIHWHGFHVDHENDGHPSEAVGPGGNYPYSFTVLNRAATYFYHPHPHELTGKQLYFGLASIFIVEDEEEINLRNSLDLSLGETDIPMVIQDKIFDDDGNLIYCLNPMENPTAMEQTMGFLGDVILVNWTVKPFMDVSARIYRFRVVNESNSRLYKLAFLRGSEKLPFYIIGTDGGLLEKPYQVTEAFIGVAERVDILFDFRSLQVGDSIYLKSLFFDPMDIMTSDMEFMESSTLMNGEEFFILKLNIKESIPYDKQVPETLSIISPIDTSGATERFFSLPNPVEGLWFINNLRFNVNEVPVSVSRNTVEIWGINNGPLAMPHPMHIHGFQFQVLERLNSPEQIKSLAIDDKGRLPTDKGWKDTVLVWPGETVRLAIDFSIPFPGEQIYLFHCHILEHEDQGMMINYKVV